MTTAPILLVEDNQDIRSVLCEALMLAGYAVRTADDGQAAFDLLDAGFLPRAMVVDLMLPKVSGWQLLKYAREDAALRQVPVVVITAVARDQARVVADAVISKPFLPSEVVRRLDELLRRPPS